MKAISAFKFFKTIKEYHANVDDKFEQPEMVITKLRAYQRRAVKWMIDREKHNDLVKSDGSAFSGGILADDTGLGKTIEMLCCIIANPSPPEFYNKKTRLYDTRNTSVGCCTHTIVMCKVCGKGQHASCKATLIVVPQSVMNDWIDEIGKHITKLGLNVLIYNGMRLDGLNQPISFNDYDVVITSYTSLSNDLYYGRNAFTNGRVHLRRSIRNTSRISPLRCIKWWRICLDQDHSIKSEVLKFISCFNSVHRWAMISTSVHKSLNDLYDTLKFLDVGGIALLDRKQFSSFLEVDSNLEYEWFSKIIWRNSLNDVYSELNLSNLITENHFLSFSDFEKFLHIRKHNEFKALIESCLKNRNNRDEYSVGMFMQKNFMLLNQLMVECTIPVYSNRLVTYEPTMTMGEHMDVVIKKSRVECETLLHSLFLKHITIAELYIIQSKPAFGVNHYMSVLSLMKKYEDMNINIDTFLKIKVMYTLSHVLDENSELLQVISNNDLKHDMERIEKEYLDGKEQIIESTSKIAKYFSTLIKTFIQRSSIKTSNWFSDLLNTIFSPKDFLRFIQTELDKNYLVKDVELINKLNSKHDILNILSVWLTDLDSARMEAISKLRTLEEASMNGLGIICNSQHNAKTKKCISNNMCLLCESKELLESYKLFLYDVPERRFYVNYKTEEDDKSTRKISQQEFLLMKILEYVKERKVINVNRLISGIKHKDFFFMIRKEFKYLQLLWTHINNWVSAHFEIDMVKQNIIHNLQSQIDADGPPKKKILKNKNDENSDITKLKSDITAIENDFKKKAARLIFHENLKNEQEISIENTCLICTFIIDSEMAVLYCGHSICRKCLTTMCENYNELNIKCPICRNEMTLDSICYVRRYQEEGIEIKGSFSTKIRSVTKKLMELIIQEPKVKVLIFSCWTETLGILSGALEINSVNHRTLMEYSDLGKKALKDFKTNANINVLLIQLKVVEIKELSLIEATRVFFIEPVLNKDVQRRVIHRIHRTVGFKPIFIHNFVFRDSIEEKITNAMSIDVDHDVNIVVKVAELFSVEKNVSMDNDENNRE